MTELEKAVQKVLETMTVEQDDAGWLLITVHKDEWLPVVKAMSKATTD